MPASLNNQICITSNNYVYDITKSNINGIHTYMVQLSFLVGCRLKGRDVFHAGIGTHYITSDKVHTLNTYMPLYHHKITVFNY